METKELLELSPGERYEYPEVLNDDAGLGIVDDEQGTHSIPSWGRRKDNLKRRVTLKISSFIGISCEAEHYYGKLEVQGVDMAYNDRPDWSTFGDEDKNPLLGYTYRIELKRKVTQEDKDKDKTARCEAERKWDGYKVGHLTDRFNSEEDLINFATEVFNARFKGDWEFKIEK